MCKHLVPLTLLLVTSGLAFGAGEYTWVGNASSSWTDPASYTLGGQPVGDLPPSGATVIFPKSSAATIDDDSIAYVSSLGRLQVAQDVQIGVSISTNAVLGCAIAGASTGTPYGTIVKTGDGRLSLAAAGTVTNTKKTSYYDYFTAFDVQSGAVAFPEADKTEYVGELSVAATASILLPTQEDVYTVAISGFGTISCAATSAKTLRVLGTGTSDFSGKLLGAKLALDAYYGTVNLSGIENDFTGNVALNGANAVLGVGKFGMKADEASSIGTGTGQSIFVKASGGMIRYLGTAADATDKEFSFYPGEEGSLAGFDAGAFGGVTFSGNWVLYDNKSNPARMRWLILTGSNTTQACTMSGDMPLEAGNDDDEPYTFTVTKRGTGIWKFAGERGLAGAINVDEGTLRFDSIAEQGERSALGTATMLYEEYNGEKDDARKVDYAIRLGDAEAGTEGTLEYDGNGFAGAKDRPIALKGDGRITHNGADGFIRLRGVSALTSGEKTLTLDGDGTSDCEISGIADGAGRVSVVKDGTGVWAITGTNTFTGSIRVKAGTLTLRNPTNYTWFRWTLKEPITCENGNYRVCEFGLFDVNSNRVNAAMTVPSGVYALPCGNLQYGEAAFTNNAVKTHSSGPLENMFDGASTIWRSNYSGMTFDRNDKSKWIPIVMHVSAAAPVYFFDFAPYYTTSYPGVSPQVFSLEGSVDGATWHDLFEENSVSVSASKWYYQTASLSELKHGGKAIDTTIPADERVESFLSNVESVQIDADATLKLEGDVSLGRIVVDSASAGTIVGGSFAEDGAIDVIADPKATMTELPLKFDGVAGVENVPKWALKVNGKQAYGYKLEVINGKLCLKKVGGLVLIFR